VHHRTIQINHQPDAPVFPFIILTSVYSSTCFGRSPAHHQELNDCSSSLWLYLRIVVIAGPATYTARLSPRYEGKTRGSCCSHWAPDDGRENTRNMLSRNVNKRQDNKLENCCIWLVIYLNWILKRTVLYLNVYFYLKGEGQQCLAYETWFFLNSDLLWPQLERKPRNQKI
jgi:hypothetical protein